MPYKFKVDKIQFVGMEPMDMKELTVVIGPNNSGKSLTIKEILQKTQRPTSDTKIVAAVMYPLPASLAEGLADVDLNVHQMSNTNYGFRLIAPMLDGEHHGHLGSADKEEYHRHYAGWGAVDRMNYFSHNFGTAHSLFLSTERRISLANENKSASADHEEANILQRLYNLPPEFEDRLKVHIKEVFNKEIRFDFSVPQSLCFRVDDQIGEVPKDPREARPILAKIPKLDMQGDGLRSYVGIALALLTVQRRLSLIDEPEAFLHPPQAVSIGKLIANCCVDDRQMVVSTHSPEVLQGLMSQKKDVRLLRIQRAKEGSKITSIEPAVLAEIVAHPLQGSAQALEGLFAEATIVVEGDADARIYGALLAQLKISRDIQFVVADNKQTVSKLVAMYTKLSVPSVGLVDIDLLSVEKEFEATAKALEMGDDDYANALAARRAIAAEVEAQAPDQICGEVLKQIEALGGIGKQIEQAVADKDVGRQLSGIEEAAKQSRKLADSTKKWRDVKAKGVEVLSKDSKVQFSTVAACFERSHLIINAFGELESTLTEFGLDYTTDKRQWFQHAMKMIPNLNLPAESKLSRSLRALVDALAVK